MREITEKVDALLVMAEMFGWDVKINPTNQLFDISLMKNLHMLNIIVKHDGYCYYKQIGVGRVGVNDDIDIVIPKICKML